MANGSELNPTGYHPEYGYMLPEVTISEEKDPGFNFKRNFNYGKRNFGSDVADFITAGMDTPLGLLLAAIPGGGRLFGTKASSIVNKLLTPRFLSKGKPKDWTNLAKSNFFGQTNKPSIIQKSLDEGAQWSKDWYTHPATIKRLESLSPIANIDKQIFRKLQIPENLSKQVQSRIALNQHRTKLPSLFGKEWTLGANVGSNSAGYYQPFTKKRLGLAAEDLIPKGVKGSGRLGVAYANPVWARTATPSRIKNLGVHEGGTHGLFPRSSYGSPQREYLTPLGETTQKGLVGVQEYAERVAKIKGIPKTEKGLDKLNKEIQGSFEYYMRPQEIHARINELRQFFNVKPGQKITDDVAEVVLKKIKEGKAGGVDKWFAEIFNDASSLRRVINYVPAVGAGAILKTKNGED
tara:strand:- start:1220 stop:2440 length:1221 start_codon:yes stop_codon:yes gene_type:complete